MFTEPSKSTPDAGVSPWNRRPRLWMKHLRQERITFSIA